MTKRMRPIGVLFFLSLALSSLTNIAFPQSIWLDRSIDRAIWLEVQKPNFTRGYLEGWYDNPPYKTTFLTTNWYLSARWRAAGPLFLKAEVPFINAGIMIPVFTGRNVGNVTVSENQFGNPYVGVEIGNPGASSFGEIGIRFPVVDDEHYFSSEFGTYTDFDRFEAFSPNVWTFTAAAKVQLKSREGLLLHLRTGPAFFLPTESGPNQPPQSGPDPELFGDYGIQLGYQSNRITLLGGFTGRNWLTEESPANRSVDQFGLSASYSAGNFIPGMLFRVPIDNELSQTLDFVFGINLGYRLP